MACFRNRRGLFLVLIFFLMEGDGRQNRGYAQNTKRRKRVRAPSRFLRSVARLVQLT